MGRTKPHRKSDAKLVKECLSGNSGSFKELIEKYSGVTYSLIYSYIQKSDQTEDLAQEVFLQAYQSLGNLRKPSKFGSWLYGITKRVCMNWLRKQKGQAISLNKFIQFYPTGDSRSQLAKFEESEEVYKVVTSLPEIYREVIFLHYYESMKYKEISKILGISTSAINARLIKARELLREKLSNIRLLKG